MRIWPTSVYLLYPCVLCARVFLQLLSHSGDGADHFLDSLLNMCECASGSSSPVWVPSPCDSGISDDPLSDHLDSPPPSSNLLLDSFFMSQHQHPFPVSPRPDLHPPPQSQEHQHSEWASSSSNRDVSIHVGKKPWFSKLFYVVKVNSEATGIYLFYYQVTKSNSKY